MKNHLALVGLAVSGCTVSAGSLLPYNTLPVAEPVAQQELCFQELGQDTGASREQAAMIDQRGVEGCMAGKDNHDSFVIDTSAGGNFELLVRAKDNIPMYIEVFELDGEKLLTASVEGHATLRRALAVRPGTQVYVKLDGYGNGRYELFVSPAAHVTAAR